MNPIAIRLLNQQLVAPQFSDPAEVVVGCGDADAQAVGEGIQTGFRQWEDYPSAPDERHMATGECRGLLDDDRPLCAQGRCRDKRLDEQQQNLNP